MAKPRTNQKSLAVTADFPQYSPPTSVSPTHFLFWSPNLKPHPLILAALFATLPCFSQIAKAADPAPSPFFDVRSYGAKGDSKTLDTQAINAAIDAASAAGGGTVFFRAGVYPAFSIHLKSNIALYLDHGVTLLAAGPTGGGLAVPGGRGRGGPRGGQGGPAAPGAAPAPGGRGPGALNPPRFPTPLPRRPSRAPQPFPLPARPPTTPPNPTPHGIPTKISATPTSTIPSSSAKTSMTSPSSAPA